MGASASGLADQGHIGVRQTPLGGVQKFLHVRVCGEERRKPYGMCGRETGTERAVHERSMREHVTTVLETSHQKSLLTEE